MPTNEIKQVLSNWIKEATSQGGRFADEFDTSKWIAQQFLKWWRTDQIERPLVDAGLAIQGIRSELERLGGWSNPQLGGKRGLARGLAPFSPHQRPGIQPWQRGGGKGACPACPLCFGPITNTGYNGRSVCPCAPAGAQAPSDFEVNIP